MISLEAAKSGNLDGENCENECQRLRAELDSTYYWAEDVESEKFALQAQLDKTEVKLDDALKEITKQKVAIKALRKQKTELTRMLKSLITHRNIERFHLLDVPNE